MATRGESLPFLCNEPLEGLCSSLRLELAGSTMSTRGESLPFLCDEPLEGLGEVIPERLQQQLQMANKLSTHGILNQSDELKVS